MGGTKVKYPAFTDTGHHWSGWPGAFCYKCGASDPMELALADGWYDPYTEQWDTEEHERKAREAERCPVVGQLKWSNEDKKFCLIKPEEAG